MQAGTGGPVAGGECGVVGNWYAQQPNNGGISFRSSRDCFTRYGSQLGCYEKIRFLSNFANTAVL